MAASENGRKTKSCLASSLTGGQFQHLLRRGAKLARWRRAIGAQITSIMSDLDGFAKHIFGIQVRSALNVKSYFPPTAGPL
jgi:hypothetical protein